MNELKLNNKRTVLVGLAFLSICSFWQMYDNLVPLILKGTFHMDESLTGAIMAADNILALFLLPLFGGLSDRRKPGKLGRRTPFILAGTAGAVILMNLLPILDNSYYGQAAQFKLVSFVIVLGLLLISMGTYRSPAVALMPDVTPKPLRSLFAGEKGWRSRLWRALVRQGEERRQAGDCFLDGDWRQKAKKARPLRDWCLTEEGVEVSLPQCAASPAAEGCPVFTVARKEKR